MKKVFIILFCIISFFSSSCVMAEGDNSNIDVTINIENVLDDEYGSYSKCYGTIIAFDKDSIIWKYTTDVVNLTELNVISDPYINSGNVYVAIDGVLYAFDLKTGDIKWNIDNVGAGNSFAFDDYGNIYISGYYGPNLVVINKNGEELYRNENLDFWWVYGLEINGNKIKYNYTDINNEDNIGYMDISCFIQSDIEVLLNNYKINFDQPPIIKDDRTLVPVRAVIEAMDGKVFWDEEEQLIILILKDDTIILNVGKKVAELNNEIQILDVAPQIINNRTLMPIRFIAEGFGFDVDWDEINQRVLITQNESLKKSEKEENKLFKDFIKNEFENINLQIQAMPYSSIMYDEYYLNSKQKVIDYYFLDIDMDGVNELVVSSNVLSDLYEYGGSCFSIWKIDENNNIFNVSAKCGMEARAAFRYRVVEYNGEILLLESTGTTNSTGSNKFRILYKLENGKFVLFKYLNYNSFEDIYVVNDENVDGEYVKNEIENLDNNINILVVQKHSI